jgi:hypothetical protein
MGKDAFDSTTRVVRRSQRRYETMRARSRGSVTLEDESLLPIPIMPRLKQANRPTTVGGPRVSIFANTKDVSSIAEYMPAR